MRFSKKVILGILLFLLVFTVSCLVLGFFSQYEPSTLITCVFSFCGVEGGILAWIKSFDKEQKGSEKNDDQ